MVRALLRRLLGRDGVAPTGDADDEATGEADSGDGADPDDADPDGADADAADDADLDDVDPTDGDADGAVPKGADAADDGGSVWDLIPSWQYDGRHVEAGGMTRGEQERALEDIQRQADAIEAREGAEATAPPDDE